MLHQRPQQSRRGEEGIVFDDDKPTRIDRRGEKGKVYSHDAGTQLDNVIQVDGEVVAAYWYEILDAKGWVRGRHPGEGAEGEIGHVGAYFVDSVVMDFPAGSEFESVL